MKRLAVACALLLFSGPAYAGLTKREQSIYYYAYNWGWLAAGCADYVSGDKSKQDFIDVVKLVREDDDLPSWAWPKMVRNLDDYQNEFPQAKACASIIKQLDGQLL